MGNTASSHHELLFGGVPDRDRRAWVRPSRNQRRNTAPSASRPEPQGRGGRLPSQRGPPSSRGGERRPNGPPRQHPPGPRYHDNEPYDDEDEAEREDAPEYMSAPDMRGQRRGPPPGEPVVLGPPRNPSRRPSRPRAPERQPRLPSNAHPDAQRRPLSCQHHAPPPPPPAPRRQRQSRAQRSVSNAGGGVRGDWDREGRRGGEGEGAARRRERR